jgi:hypothetical protein
MIKRLEISRDIAVAPERVYAAISDVTRMGEWSEECHACEWHEGYDGPVVGATFDGHTGTVSTSGQRRARLSRPTRAKRLPSSAR